MVEVASSPKPESLLQYLNDSLECEICTESNELRLLPCQHMICLRCLEDIQKAAIGDNKEFLCAFCRVALTKNAEDYPVCRLARNFKQQVHQLQRAIRRRTITRRGTQKMGFRGNEDGKSDGGQIQPDLSTNLSGTEEETSRQNLSLDIGKIDADKEGFVRPEKEYTEKCQSPGCESQDVDWICSECRSFLCKGCTSKYCGEDQGNRKCHIVMFIDDEVENSIEQFVTVEDLLRTEIDKGTKQFRLLVSQVQQTARDIAERTLHDFMHTDPVQEMTKHNTLLRSCVAKLEDDKEMLDALEEFIKEASNVEYVMVAHWIFEHGQPVLSESSNQPRFDASLGKIEILSRKACLGIARFSHQKLVIGRQGTFDFLELPECRMFPSGHILDNMGGPRLRFNNNKLYFLLKDSRTNHRQVLVLDSITYTQLFSWRVQSCEFIGDLEVMKRLVYVANKESVDVYKLTGELVTRFPFQRPSQISCLTRYGENQLAVCNYAKNEITVLDDEGNKVWSCEVARPAACSEDLRGNLWAWSKETEDVSRIVANGQTVQKFLHRAGDKLQAVNILTMCATDGYLWMTSPQLGLFRYPIKYKGAPQEEMELKSPIITGLKTRLSAKQN